MQPNHVYVVQLLHDCDLPEHVLQPIPEANLSVLIPVDFLFPSQHALLEHLNREVILFVQNPPHCQFHFPKASFPDFLHELILVHKFFPPQFHYSSLEDLLSFPHLSLASLEFRIHQVLLTADERRGFIFPPLLGFLLHLLRDLLFRLIILQLAVLQRLQKCRVPALAFGNGLLIVVFTGSRLRLFLLLGNAVLLVVGSVEVGNIWTDDITLAKAFSHFCVLLAKI